MENTYNIRCRSVDGAGEMPLSDLLNVLQGAMSGDMVFVVDPATLTSAATAAAWTRTVTVELQNAAGEVQTWFNKAIATGVSIADSSAGTATIPSTTLTFVDGVATVVVSGNAASWAGGTKQVDKARVTHICDSAGTITVTVAGAPLAESVDVALEVAANDTAAQVAAKIVAALNLNATVAAAYVASVMTTDYVGLTAVLSAADDDTLAITFADTDTTGVTMAASANVTAGVAPDTDTLTVAQASIMGYTIAAKTSVETFR